MSCADLRSRLEGIRVPTKVERAQAKLSEVLGCEVGAPIAEDRDWITFDEAGMLFDVATDNQQVYYVGGRYQKGGRRNRLPNEHEVHNLQEVREAMMREDEITRETLNSRALDLFTFGDPRVSSMALGSAVVSVVAIFAVMLTVAVIAEAPICAPLVGLFALYLCGIALAWPLLKLIERFAPQAFGLELWQPQQRSSPAA